MSASLPPVKVPGELLERVIAALSADEDKSKFLRRAIEAELKRRDMARKNVT